MKILIVSYSYSGHTHRIAQKIQEYTCGDWYEIHPWQPYPAAFPELLEQVKKEIGSKYYPRLLPPVRSPHPYSLIFAGCPNWCGTIAPPLASWLYRNDLSGKTVLPFYSHCGGTGGDLREDMARLCPRSDVREAMGVIGDGGENFLEILNQWLDRTGVEEEIICSTQNLAIQS